MDTLARLSTLYKCTQALGVQRDLDALIDQVLAAAQELSGCEHCALMLFDPERGELVLRRIHGYGQWRAGILGLRLPLGQGLSGCAAAQREALRVGDVQADARYLPGLEGARSNLAVPLLVRNELLGVLNVESSRVDAFSEEHEKLCTVLGSQAALALEASRARERLEQRLSELDALYRLSRLAAEGRNLEHVLGGILEAALALLPAGSAALLLHDGTAGELTVRAARGPGAPEMGRPAPAEGSAVRCARTRQAVLVAETPGDAALQAADVRSEVATPLLVEGRVAGVLYVGAPQPRAFTREHARTLAMLAQQSALVLGAAQMRDELRRLAVTDALTGLFNRRHFLSEVQEQLRRTRRYGSRLAVAVLDLDGFKALNDQHGHAAGDQALQAFGDVLRECVRDSDLVARLGGDEFAALLLEADADEARQVLERLRGRVAGARLSPAGLTLSAGVACFPEHGHDAHELLQRADVAMYQAKRLGRNRVELFG